jgi:hypothetical protein
MADAFEKGMIELDHLAVENRDARQLRKALLWIAAHTDKTVAERVAAGAKLLSLPAGPVVIGSMRFFTGW